jgi:hypothetical protein
MTDASANSCATAATMALAWSSISMSCATTTSLRPGAARHARLLRREGESGAGSAATCSPSSAPASIAPPWSRSSMALAAGATAERISFGNTIKKERDVARALRSACASSRSTARPRSRRSPAANAERREGRRRSSAASCATARAPSGRSRASSAACRRWRRTCSSMRTASASRPMACRSMSVRSRANRNAWDQALPRPRRSSATLRRAGHPSCRWSTSAAASRRST